jgi:hypothetical protein
MTNEIIESDRKVEVLLEQLDTCNEKESTEIVKELRAVIDSCSSLVRYSLMLTLYERN